MIGWHGQRSSSLLPIFLLISHPLAQRQARLAGVLRSSIGPPLPTNPACVPDSQPSWPPLAIRCGTLVSHFP